jgi:hypothetical protein
MRCSFCYNALLLMREISGPEREPLRPIYEALYEAVVTDICIWAMVDPPREITGSARCIHASMHRLFLQNLDKILAQAQAEVRKRAREYGVAEEDVSGGIQDLIQAVSWASGRKREPHI